MSERSTIPALNTGKEWGRREVGEIGGRNVAQMKKAVLLLMDIQLQAWL